MHANADHDPRSPLRQAVADSYAHVDAEGLVPPPSELIRAGRAGGLPFDSLTTDVVAGCLPRHRICFGNCFAATAAFAAGHNFGRRTPNVFDADTLRDDLARMPAAQRYVRNGWNSDPSWNWELTSLVTELVRESERLPVVLSKAFRRPDRGTLARLARQRVELRLTLSAFDAPGISQQRLDVCEDFRALGGIAVPVVVTTAFREARLNHDQAELIEEIRTRNLPAAENSLRFDANGPLTTQIDLTQAREVHGTEALWTGRLYETHLTVPTITSVPDHYDGLPSAFASEIPPAMLDDLFNEPVPTADEVQRNVALPKPRQAGVVGVTLRSPSRRRVA